MPKRVNLRRLTLSQAVPRPIEEVFEFFADPCNLQRLTPAFLHFHFLREPPPRMQAGTRLDYRVRLYGVPLRWVTFIDEFESPYRFIDSQMRGPYTSWRHTHVFEAVSKNATLIRDLIEYRMPLGLLGEIAHKLLVARILQRIFDFRTTERRGLLGRIGSRLRLTVTIQVVVTPFGLIQHPRAPKRSVQTGSSDS